MLFLFILLFIAVPIAELWLIIEVGQWLGVLPTIAILIADSIIGSFLLRHQGKAAWRRLNDAIAQGRMPHREIVDGALILVGGVLLLTPGFITDILGLAMLLPPTRTLMRRAVMSYARRHIARRTVIVREYPPQNGKRIGDG